MHKRKIVVLGAGISGLSLGWFLKKKWGSELDLQILEKTSRPGGWIQTELFEGSVFEQGPRSCRTRGNGLATLELIEELGMTDQVLLPNSSASKRFIYTQNTLQSLPNGILSLIRSHWKKMLLIGLWNEWNAPRGGDADESIYDFSLRRFGSDITELFVDPLTSGIYAGNIRELSVRSCFPEWMQREKEHGGILRSLWKGSNKKNQSTLSPFLESMKKQSIFGLRNGMESLITSLEGRLIGDISYQSEIAALEFGPEKVSIGLINGKVIEADHVYSTLPAFVLGNLLKKKYPHLAEFPLSIPHTSLVVATIGYKKERLVSKGFGYLVPSKEKESFLGMVWDSCVFPEQNGFYSTRLTLMIGGAHHPEIVHFSDNEILQSSLKALRDHLGIVASPDYIHLKRCVSAIPQYRVGHEEKKMEYLKTIKNEIPRLSVLGISFHGVSVNDCIAQAKKQSENLLLQ